MKFKEDVEKDIENLKKTIDDLKEICKTNKEVTDLDKKLVNAISIISESLIELLICEYRLDYYL